MKKKEKAVDHQTAYDEFMKEVEGGGGYFKFDQGDTGFVPVYMEGEAPVSAFGRTLNINDGKEFPRYVFYARLVDADAKDKFPDDYEEKLYPIFVSKRMAKQLGVTLAGSKMKAGATFTSLNAKGELTYGDLYIMHREGVGLATTYTLTTSTIEGYDDVLDMVVEVPEQTIQEYADDCTEQAYERAKGQQAPAASMGSNDSAGFQ
jgi:hypothetical protein